MASGADYADGGTAATRVQVDPRERVAEGLMPRDAEVQSHELLLLDQLEEVTRTEDPDSLERFLDGLPVNGARNLWHRLREANREHLRRAERLERMAGVLSQHLHAAADGQVLSDRPQPAMDPGRPF